MQIKIYDDFKTMLKTKFIKKTLILQEKDRIISEENEFFSRDFTIHTRYSSILGVPFYAAVIVSKASLRAYAARHPIDISMSYALIILGDFLFSPRIFCFYSCCIFTTPISL